LIGRNGIEGFSQMMNRRERDFVDPRFPFF